MRESHFIESHRPTWQRFEGLLEAADRDDPEAPMAELPELYRQVCQHLSIAKHRGYRAEVVRRLNQLVERGHAELYGTRSGRWGPLLDYIRGGFARDVREDWHLFLISAALFAGPFLGMHLWLQLEPEWAYHVLGPAMTAKMEAMYSDPSVRPPSASSSDFMMFGFYIMHNISIAFRTLVSGLLAGFGSFIALIFNGTILGAVGGHLNNAGLSKHFWPFVIGHGSFELTAIVLSGQAGFKIGFAPIWPGRRTRLQALREEARDSIGLIAGFFVMLLVAAFIEAFWSASAAPAQIKYLVGAMLWLVVIVYFAFAGRAA